MKNGLIERYIYAVTRHLPVKGRKDIEKELNSIIDDMLLGNCGNTKPVESDIKAVLTELGSPEELAIKYNGNENKSLIGGIYYVIYTRIFKTVAPIIAVVFACLTFFTGIIKLEESNIIQLFLKTLFSGIGGIMQFFVILTCVFAVLDYKKVQIHNNGDVLSNLPTLPEDNEKIKFGESIISIIGTFFIIYLLSATPFFGIFYKGQEWIPLFNADVIQKVWYFLFGWGLFSVVSSIAEITEGRYTKRLALILTVSGIFQCIFTILVFSQPNITNLEFFAKFSEVFENLTITQNQIENAPLIVIGVVIFGTVSDIANTIYKSIKYSR